MPTEPTLSRRHALLGSAAAAGTLALPRTSHAEPASDASDTPKVAPTQVAGSYRLSLGNVEVTVISDGTFPLAPAHPLLGTNTTEAQMRDALDAAFVPYDHVIGHVNTLLINTGERLILIDAGCGQAFGPTVGKLRRHLAAVGADPADIDTVVITHLHGDHIGGLLTDAKASWLPKARFVMHEAERDFWSADTPDLSKTGVPDEMKAGFAQAAKTALTNIGDRLDLVSDKRTQLDPALAVYHCPGHTPGHLLGGLYGNTGQFGYMADLIHFAPVQFAHPGWHIAFDTDPEEAADTRHRILNYYAKKRKPVAGSHLPFPGVGHVRAEGDAFAYVPAVWRWDPSASDAYQVPAADAE